MCAQVYCPVGCSAIISNLGLGHALDGRVNAAILLKVLSQFSTRNINHRAVLDRARHHHVFVVVAFNGMLNKLAQNTSQGLTGSRLGNHALALDYAAERGDGPNLFTH
jgi:hypothetical protein